ncbi:MAG: hypothetical protein HQ557_11570 [Bacteroidetes bacterium]|nr:hypothetical protein [Bacteroidota bacterium]
MDSRDPVVAPIGHIEASRKRIQKARTHQGKWGTGRAVPAINTKPGG